MDDFLDAVADGVDGVEAALEPGVQVPEAYEDTLYKRFYKLKHNSFVYLLGPLVQVPRAYAMALMLDGNYEIGVHIRSNLC